MRWRRPPFGLVLTAVIGLAALAVVLLGGGSSSPGGTGSSPVKTVPGGRVRACLTTRAQARATLHGTVTATTTATAPLKVVQKVRGSTSVITVTRTASFTARVSATRVVGVTQVAVGSAHACATASSGQAAKGLAIRHAYASALQTAHHQATNGARTGLKRLESRVYPKLLAQARSEAQQRAQAQAAAARPALTAAAHGQAAKLAGGASH